MLIGNTVHYSNISEMNAKMVTFAGYAMPIQYSLGVLKEHQQVRGKSIPATVCKMPFAPPNYQR